MNKKGNLGLFTVLTAICLMGLISLASCINSNDCPSTDCADCQEKFEQTLKNQEFKEAYCEGELESVKLKLSDGKVIE